SMFGSDSCWHTRSCITCVWLVDGGAILDICAFSLHDALPIYNMTMIVDRMLVDLNNRLSDQHLHLDVSKEVKEWVAESSLETSRDRKSTRLNSSHVSISYAVFCLKKKKIITFIKYSGISEPLN